MQNSKLFTIIFALITLISSGVYCEQIESGETKIGSITSNGYSVSYTFYGTAGHGVFISMSRDSGTLNPYIILGAPDGQVEATANAKDGAYSGSSYEHAEITEHVLLKSGTYTIVGSDYGGNNTGNFSLSFVKYPDSTIWGEINSGETKKGTIFSNAYSVSYTFNGNAGDGVFIIMGRDSGTLNPYIILGSPNGEVEAIAHAQDGAYSGSSYSHAEIIDYQLKETGVYTIIGCDYGGNHTGDFSISYVIYPETTKWGEILSGETKEELISATGYSISYTFNGNAGDGVFIYLSRDSGTLNPYIILGSPNGEVEAIAHAQDGAYSGSSYSHAEIIDYQLKETGVYTIIGCDYGGNHTGDCSLSYVQYPGSTLWGEIATGNTKKGTISSNGFSVSYTFNGNVGDGVFISMSRDSGTLNPYILLCAPDGQVEATAHAQDGAYSGSSYEHAEITNHKLLQSGSYTIIGCDYGGNHTGDFSLSFSHFQTNPTLTPTKSLTQTPTFTPTPSLTQTKTSTPNPTLTPTNTFTPTLTQTQTLTPTFTPNPTLTPTSTTPIPTPTPSILFGLSLDPENSNYSSGDYFNLLFDVETHPSPTPVDIYFVMIKVPFTIYFGFDWVTTQKAMLENFPLFGNLSITKATMLELSIPNMTPPISEAGTYIFAIAAAKPGTIDFISNIATISFDVGFNNR